MPKQYHNYIKFFIRQNICVSFYTLYIVNILIKIKTNTQNLYLFFMRISKLFMYIIIINPIRCIVCLLLLVKIRILRRTKLCILQYYILYKKTHILFRWKSINNHFQKKKNGTDIFVLLNIAFKRKMY